MSNNCCKGFLAKFNKQGQKGFSVEKSENEDSYKIVYRPFDQIHEYKLVSEVSRTGFAINLNLSGEINIKFCPWCGSRLSPIKD